MTPTTSSILLYDSTQSLLILYLSYLSPLKRPQDCKQKSTKLVASHSQQEKSETQNKTKQKKQNTRASPSSTLLGVQPQNTGSEIGVLFAITWNTGKIIVLKGLSHLSTLTQMTPYPPWKENPVWAYLRADGLAKHYQRRPREEASHLAPKVNE